MQAARSGQQGRDIMSHEMRRQREQDELNRRKAESGMRTDEAHADYYKAAKGAQEAMANVRETPKWYPLGDFGWIDPQGQLHLAPNKAAPDPKSETELLTRILANPATSPEERAAIRKRYDHIRGLEHPVPQRRPVIVPPSNVLMGTDNKPVYTAPPRPFAPQREPSKRRRYVKVEDGKGNVAFIPEPTEDDPHPDPVEYPGRGRNTDSADGKLANMLNANKPGGNPAAVPKINRRRYNPATGRIEPVR